MKATARGQTLVLFALTALLLTLMVMMTISIGSKAKEKMEVQTLADAAAYSNSVATARTFNSVSVMNRVQVAHMVGVTAVNSLVSWATYYFANVNVARGHYKQWEDDFNDIRKSIMGCCSAGGGFPCKSGCCNGIFCPCSTAGYYSNKAIVMTLNLERVRFLALLMALDAQAAAEALAYRNSADYVYYFGQLPALYFLYSYLNNQSGASGQVGQAQAGNPYAGELSASDWPDSVNFKELKPMGGAIIPVNPIYAHHVNAAMGSRLHPFLTGRGGPAMAIINPKLMTLIPPIEAMSVQAGMGSGYLTMIPGERHGDSFVLEAAFTRFVSADDHSQGGLRSSYYFPPTFLCPVVRQRQGNPKSMINSGTGIGIHQANGWFDNLHLLPGNLRMYPFFVDYNPFLLTDETNVWGQPKTYGMVQRDYTKRAIRQSNPFFRFNFASGAQYDNRALNLKDGTFIGRQMALSTGITYYHRGNNFLGFNSQVEPPNFFNPFWRAGLTRLNVDDPAASNGDVENALSSYPAAVDAFQGLRSNGFKGWQ